MTLHLEEKKKKRIQNKVSTLKKFYDHLTAFIIVNIVFALTSNISEINIHIFRGYKISNLWSNFDHPKIFPLWLVWGIFLLLNAIHVFSVPLFFGEQWENKKIESIMKDDKEQVKKYLS